MKPLTHPYLHTIFCEDLRHESNGKLFYIGVYNGDLISPVFPVVLQKLVLIASYAYPFEESEADAVWRPAQVVVTLDEDVVLEIDDPQTPRPSGPLEGSRGHMSTYLMSLSPIELKHPGRLRVRVKLRDGTEIIGNALNCRTPLVSEVEPQGQS